MGVALLAVSAWGDVAFDTVEVVGHVLAEFFNPGDYFETSRPACFVRRQARRFQIGSNDSVRC